MNASEFYDNFFPFVRSFGSCHHISMSFFFVIIRSCGFFFFLSLQPFFCMCLCHLLLFRLHSVWISMNFKQIINSQLEYVLYSIMVFAVDWTISFAFSFPCFTLSLSLRLSSSLPLAFDIFSPANTVICYFVRAHFCNAMQDFICTQNKKLKCFDFGKFLPVLPLRLEFINLYFNLLICFQINWWQ